MGSCQALCICYPGHKIEMGARFLVALCRPRPRISAKERPQRAEDLDAGAALLGGFPPEPCGSESEVEPTHLRTRHKSVLLQCIAFFES